jgi:rubrerythrin
MGGEGMEQKDFIDGCIKVENSVASIYSNLMKTFPERKEFWGSLLNDEREHIAFLSDVKSLALITEMEKLDFPPSMNVIKKTLKLTDKVRNKLSDNLNSLKDTLKMALKLEESMVEIYTNQMIAKLLSCEDEAPIEKVVADEKAHINMIRKMMKQV